MNIEDKRIEEQYEIIENVIKTFGTVAQKIKSIEELGELITVLSKNYLNQATDDQVIDEIADVIIMCLQLSHMYGHKDIDSRIDFKMERLKKLLHDNQSNEKISNKTSI